MSNKLPKPHKNAIIYEDSKLYACLANFPIVRGHTVVVWKDNVEDLHLLSRSDYEYLMDKVNMIRDAILDTLNLEKVYLLYMDEVKQVHWHLVPRYEEMGMDLLNKKPEVLNEFKLDDEIRKNLKI
jgi:diadenosine tetraphosphate (Ap4A) HIT family hydrolase